MWIRKLMDGTSPLTHMLLSADGVGSGGGDAGGNPSDEGDPGTVLFPNEGDDKKPEGDGDAGDDKPEGEGDDKDDGDKGADDGDKKSDDPADQVPEDGKYDLKMPDGIELDAELAEALGPEFAEAKLTNGQAQKLVDKYIEIQKQRAEKDVSEWGETIEKWAEEARSDKEIGGAKWDETTSSARRAVETLGTPELREYLNWSGGGNHPELIRFMAKVGAMIKEDNPATGGAEGAGKPVEAAHALFPTDAPKG